MNKYLFLGRLQAALEKSLAQEDVQATIDYYENYLLEAVEYGQTEAEVISSLGNPEELAKQIIAGLEGKETPKQNSIEFGSIVADVMEAVNDVNDFAIKHVNAYMAEDTEPLEGNYEFLGNKAEELDLTAFSSIEVRAKNGNVRIGLSDDDGLHVYHDENALDKVEIYRCDKTLVIRSRKAKIMSMFDLKKTSAMTILLPSSYKQRIDFNVKNGAIQLDGKKGTFKAPLYMNCDNGYVKVKDAYLGFVDISCDNGMVDLFDVLSLNTQISCCNGVVKYDIMENEYGKVIQATAKNGLIRLNHEKVSLGYLNKTIPSKNNSKFQLQMNIRCDNGLVKLTGF